MHDQVLTQKQNNYLAAVHIDRTRAGIAFLDISTGEFMVAEGKLDYIQKLAHNFQPNEVLFNKPKYNQFSDTFGNKFYTYGIDEWVFSLDYCKEKIENQFQLKSLKGFGIEKLNLATTAAGVILHYLGETHNERTDHIRGISRIEEDQYVWLDHFTIKSLELLSSDHPDAITLMDVVDKTVTPMGGRMMRKWMLLPLKNIEAIQERHAAVAELISEQEISQKFSDELIQLGDIERIISKISVGKVSPKEVLILKDSIQAANKVQVHSKASQLLSTLLKDIKPLVEVVEKIATEIYPEAPAVIGKGRLIADGVNKQLDEYREISTKGKDYLLNLQKEETERTGISSLKIAYNNVFGYYLEVRNAHKDKVPEEWIRKQTLVNAERYITQELKELETKILSAEEKINGLEAQIFKKVVEYICKFLGDLQFNAKKIAELDCLLSFSKLAKKNNYTQPVINDSLVLDIKNGRHPVIEQNLPVGNSYIANDLYLDNATQQIIMVTGPNMAGKSALLRQTALIALLAQMGSFVPADSAVIGIIDRIFTRVGASDNISTGESTFMVEMNETSNILNNLSERSLILLDEIGRGTSTYDGVSIAWAISEYLHEYPLFKAKTLFATHYHELNKMTEQFARIKNFNVTVKEHNGKVIFMRKLMPGGSEHSFGIHVAKLAGMPKTVVNRANEVLNSLEGLRKDHQVSDQKTTKKTKAKSSDSSGMQLSFIQLDDPILEQIRDEIKDLDINTLTPVEALMKLNEIKRHIGN